MGGITDWITGSASDAGAQVNSGKQASALQQQIYNDSKQANEPYLQTGQQGLAVLANYLGLPGYSPISTTGYKQPVTSYGGANGPSSAGAVGGGNYSNPLDPNWTIGTATTINNPGKKQTVDTAPTYDYNDPGTYGQLLKSYSGDALTDDPGYQFRLAQGQKATERQLAAGGKYLTPEATKALMDYGQGSASQEYQNAYSRYNNDQSTIFNRLAAIAGIGQTATGQQQASATNYGNAQSDLITGMGNAQTAAAQAASANRVGLFTAGAKAAATSGASGSDMRLKENIEPAGEEHGFKTYTWNYKDRPDQRYYGVMAHEVEQIMPEAVIIDDAGYKAVFYDMIGIKMREVAHAD